MSRDTLVAWVVENEGITQKRQCHARESGHPDLAARAGPWIPAYAGMSASVMLSCQEGESPSDVKS